MVCRPGISEAHAELREVGLMPDKKICRPRGGRPKITASDRLHILNCLEAGDWPKVLAKEYGLSTTYIYNLRAASRRAGHEFH